MTNLEIADELERLFEQSTPDVYGKGAWLLLKWRDIVAALRAPDAGADARDAALFRAIGQEWDENRRYRQVPAGSPKQYAKMPIWDAMCDAIGADAGMDGLRTAIDAALAAQGQP